MFSSSSISYHFILISLISLPAGSSAWAATIQLRGQCTPAGNLIRLEEVADIIGADPLERQALGKLELFPVPVTGSSRIRAADIQQALLRRGVDLARHTFQGASEVSLTVRETAPAVTVEREIPQSVVQKKLRDAVVSYLRQAGGDEPWEIKVLDGIPKAGNWAEAPLRVLSGGRAPWTGEQRFLVTCEADSGQRSELVEIRCQVLLPPSLLVAAHPIPKGTFFKADDVRIQRGLAAGTPSGYKRVEDVIGKQSTRDIYPGQVLTAELVEQPKLVNRGEVVTVYVRRPGIQIRTVARAREDGAHGDLIHVESMTNRDTFLARVTAYQVVEVFATADRVTSSAPRR